jgi:hypothetical protein
VKTKLQLNNNNNCKNNNNNNNIRTGLSLFRSTYHSLSPHNIPTFYNLSPFFINSCWQVKRLVNFKEVTKVKVSHWSVDISPVNLYQCGVSLFWPTFHTFLTECQYSASRCITAYLWCCCYTQASTFTYRPSICAQCQ